MFLCVLASFEQKGMGPTTETTINGPKNHKKYFYGVSKCEQFRLVFERISEMLFHFWKGINQLGGFHFSVFCFEIF